MFVLANLTSPSCAGVQPQKLGYWFCSQNLWLSSRIAFGSSCQIISRGYNLAMDCTGFYLLIHPRIFYVEFEFVLVENTGIEDNGESIPTLIHQTEFQCFVNFEQWQVNFFSCKMKFGWNWQELLLTKAALIALLNLWSLSHSLVSQ